MSHPYFQTQVTTPPLAVQVRSTVLGAGLLGRLLAHELVSLGHHVDIYDKGGPEGTESAARAAAAMLAPLAESVITEPSVVRMGHYGLTRWPQIIQTLNQPVFFQQNGTLILWHRQDAHEAKRFSSALHRNHALMRYLGAPEELTSAGLQALEPGLQGNFQQGIYLPGEGQLDNRQLLAALHSTLVQRGVNFHWNTPKSLEDFGTLDSLGSSDSDNWLFDCRGLGAKPSWTGIRGVRGEVIRLYAPEVTLSRPMRLIHPRYPLYIAPKEDHVFVIGATEIESEDLSNASVRSTLELLSAAYTVHSGFAEARILEISTQARPTLQDNLPAIQQLGPKTLQINGLYRHGFLISPAVVDAALDFVRTASHDKADAFGVSFTKP